MRPPTAPSPAPHTTTRSTAQPSASPYPRSSIARRTPLGADATKMISQRRRPSGGRRVQRASFCLKAAGSCWLYSSMCRNTRRMLRAAFTSRFHRRVAVLVRAVITARRGCRRSFSLFPLCPQAVEKNWEIGCPRLTLSPPRPARQLLLESRRQLLGKTLSARKNPVGPGRNPVGASADRVPPRHSPSASALLTRRVPRGRSRSRPL